MWVFRFCCFVLLIPDVIIFFSSMCECKEILLSKVCTRTIYKVYFLYVDTNIKKYCTRMIKQIKILLLNNKSFNTFCLCNFPHASTSSTHAILFVPALSYSRSRI